MTLFYQIVHPTYIIHYFPTGPPQNKDFTFLLLCDNLRAYQACFNSLSTNPTKWSNTLKQFVCNLPTNCLSVFDHFVKLALKGLTHKKMKNLKRFFLLQRKFFSLCNLTKLEYATFYPINFDKQKGILTMNIFKKDCSFPKFKRLYFQMQ